MKKHFYSHIIEIDTIIIHLDLIDLSDKQRTELLALIDTNLYHVILDVVMSELSTDDKKVFLQNLLVDDHDSIWAHLKENITDVEKKIFHAAEELKEELKRDIEEVIHKGKK